MARANHAPTRRGLWARNRTRAERVLETQQVATPDDAIDVLGGTGAVAKLFGIENTRVVSNWRKRGLTPETFMIFHAALTAKGCKASPSLWKQREAAAS